MNSTQAPQIRGRFAPSPSGPLHFGSLLAALGSFLHAKSNDGLWFVRIEDIDTTRVVADAESQILDALRAFGMPWDTDLNTASQLNDSDQNCLHQTARLARYQEVLSKLESQQLVYGCDCTRKQIKQMPNGYNGHCKNRALDLNDNAVRLHCPSVTEFDDELFGRQLTPPEFLQEDYIIKRRDGLFSYQLAVVVDDIDQGITHVVRGADIMPLTGRQISLFQFLGQPAPKFLHLPLIASAPGLKLSKQNHAQAIDTANPKPELLKGLSLLGLPVQDAPYLAQLPVSEIMDWAIENANISSNNEALTQQTEIII